MKTEKNKKMKVGFLQKWHINTISTVLLMTLMLVYLAVTVRSSAQLAEQTDIISTHPFEVVISAGDVKLYISEMSIRTGRLHLHWNDDDIKLASEALDKLYVSLKDPLLKLHELYLGKKSDIDELEKTIVLLKEEQQTFLEYVTSLDADSESGNIEDYDQKNLQPLYTQIINEAENIIASAQEKKIGYGKKSESLRKSTLIGSAILIALMIAVHLISQYLLWIQKKELIYRNRLFDSLSQSIDDTFIIRDVRTAEISYCALNMERVLGFAIDNVETIYQGLKKEDAEEIKCSINSPDFVFPYEKVVEFRKQNGDVLWLSIRIYLTDKLKTPQFITVFSDRTKEVLARQTLLDAMDNAERANMAKSEFLSRMSHEIRTPLNAITGMTAIASASVHDPAKLKDCFDKINLSSRHLMQLINDVLDMSKIESNKVVLQNEPFDFIQVLGNFIATVDSQAKAKGIIFDYETVGFGEQAIFIGDSLRLTQILLNLSSNAVKFTDTGGRIRLEVRKYLEKAKIVVIRFRISDTGIGMDEDAVNRIFKPFEQADASIAGRYGGSGLGMSITQNLVMLMNGKIQVESRLGVGTTFQVDLPFNKSRENQLDEKIPVYGGAAEGSKVRLDGLKILLAEDNELNREIAKTLLEMNGAVVDCAKDGQEAAEIFEASETGAYDAVLMDIQMPRMNGYEAARRIRGSSHPQAGEIPIIAVTANAFSDDITAARAAGMDGHVSKPLDLEQLLNMLSSVCKE